MGRMYIHCIQGLRCFWSLYMWVSSSRNTVLSSYACIILISALVFALCIVRPLGGLAFVKLQRLITVTFPLCQLKLIFTKQLCWSAFEGDSSLCLVGGGGFLCLFLMKIKRGRKLVWSKGILSSWGPTRVRGAGALQHLQCWMERTGASLGR